MLVYVGYYGTWAMEVKPQRSEESSSWCTDGFSLSTILTNNRYKLSGTGVFFPCRCIIRDRYDGNVFNSLRAKWRSGTARLVVSGFRTRETCAASTTESSLHGGADATTARGWRACSAEARSHEWTFLLTPGAAWYCRTAMTDMSFTCSFKDGVETLLRVGNKALCKQC